MSGALARSIPRPRRRVIGLAGGAALLLATAVIGNATPATAAPSISLARTINAPPPTDDLEGVAFVPVNNSLWLADDDGYQLLELDKDTGALKRVISQATLAAAPQFGGGPAAGKSRAKDFEAVAYDATNDVLYVFAGPCCSEAVLPAVFRLVRQSGSFVVDSYQPLSRTGVPNDLSGAGFVGGQLWAAQLKSLYTYNYPSNSFSFLATVSGVSGNIYGISDGNVPWIVTSSNRLYKLDANTRQVVSGFNFDLTAVGMLDPRAVDVVGNQVIVVDSYDGVPTRHAVDFFNVIDDTVPSPSASFVADRTSGSAPLTVQFTDTSSGSPTSWSWNFGDGTTSTLQNPSKVFTSIGTFLVQLTATNAGGSSVANTTITVRVPAPTASFTTDRTSGNAPLTVQFTDTSSGGATSWAWDFGDGTTSTLRNPSHTYTVPGEYTASLVASNSSGSSTLAFAEITASLPAPTASFTATPSGGPAPLTVQFTDTSTGSPTSWAWDFGDGSPIVETQHPTHVYATPGQFTATLSARNVGGQTTANKSFAITVPTTTTTTTTPPTTTATTTTTTPWPTTTTNPSPTTTTTTTTTTTPSPTTTTTTTTTPRSTGTGGTSGSGTAFQSLQPQRLLDTRVLGTTSDGRFQRLGAVQPGQRLLVDIGGRGGVPLGASAVVLNVTAVDAGGDGYLTVWPCDTVQPPNASNLNFAARQTVANLVVVPLDANGRVCIQTALSATDVLADTSGYFPNGSGYVPRSPRRLLDTRAGGATIDGQFAAIGTPAAATTVTLQVTGRAGLVPAGAAAVVLNITAPGPASDGYLTVWPCNPADPPNASSLNFVAGRDVPNLVIVPLSATGSVCLQTARSASDLIADLAGYFPAGSAYLGVSPQRLLDSRSGGATIDGRFAGVPGVGAGNVVELPVTGRAGVPSTAIAAALNVTAASGSGSGFVTVWSCTDPTAPAPDVSSINFAVADIANAVIVPLTSRGTVCLQARDGSAQLIADLNGYFTG